MPTIGALTGGVNFSGLSITCGNAILSYGKFLQATFVFLIVAFCLFMVMKAVNAMKKKKEEEWVRHVRVTPKSVLSPTPHLYASTIKAQRSIYRKSTDKIFVL